MKDINIPLNRKPRAGLVSVSFRSKSCEDIIKLAVNAGLSGIEWGGDVHVPTGDLLCAKAVGQATRDAGLSVVCYGSYFRLGVNDVSEFDIVVNTAVALEAPVVRIWAYDKERAKTTKNEWDRIVSEGRQVFEIAKRRGLNICFEYHRGSLTADSYSAHMLFQSIGAENQTLHWQPNPEQTTDENISELKTICPVEHIHVFSWTCQDGKNLRHPLEYGKFDWENYRDVILSAPLNNAPWFLLEFFENDSEEQFLRDADILKRILDP